MGDASKFWEIMASVIPVIALAFVVEVRYLRLDEMGPFRRLATALTHAATILVLLFSEIAALNSLAGTPQADWAKHVALNGCAAALAVVLSAPATKFLLVGIYGTHPSTYKRYLQAKRLLRTYRNQQRRLNRVLRKNARQHRTMQGLVTTLEEKWARLPAHDLQTIWAKEATGAHLEVGRTLVADIETDRAEILQALAEAKKNQRKMERKVVKTAGRQTKRILREYEKAGV